MGLDRQVEPVNSVLFLGSMYVNRWSPALSNPTSLPERTSQGGAQVPETVVGDRFRIERVLGQGGSGQVLVAFDSLRGRRVALRRIRSDHPGELRRLRLELRSLLDLAHLHLCVLHDVHEVEGRLYLAMEYVDGIDLRRWCRPATTRVAAEAGRGPGDPLPVVDPPVWTGTQGGAERVEGGEDPSAPLPIGDAPVWTGTQGGAERVEGGEDPSAPLPIGDAPVWTGTQGGAEHVDGEKDPSAPLPVGDDAHLARIRAAYLQLVDALEVLHATGRVHGDLKPSNVRVTREGRLVVLDVGLAAAKAGRQVEGTTAYLAPERFVTTSDRPAVDWFAVGVMLYDSLVDGLPFATVDAIRGLRPEFVPDPRDVRPEIPEALALLCRGLLHPDPSRRASGAHVRAVLDPARTPALPPLFALRRLVGREAALASLDEAARETRRGVDALVHLHGRSGDGKSSLLEAFVRERVGGDEDVVLVGRCHERHSVPYRMFDGVVETLSALLGARLASPTPGTEVAAIHRLFPSMDTTLDHGGATYSRGLGSTSTTSLASASTAPEAWQTGPLPPVRIAGAATGPVVEPAVNALGRVLAELAGARPVVMVIDDVQWADHDSLHLLEVLLASVERPPLLVVLASREEDRETPLVRGLDRVLEAHAAFGDDPSVDARRSATFRRLHVGPLARAEVAEIVAALPAQDDDGAAASISVDALVAETGGSPLLVQPLATLRAAGVLRAGEGLEVALRLRVETLPDEARALLTTVCLAGHPLPQDEAWRAAVDGAACEEAVHALRVAGLVRTGGGGPRDVIEPAHDVVREAVARWTPAERRRDVHARLAAVLEATPRIDPGTCAAHWREGGDLARAVALARQAALQAERSAAWDRVAEMLALVEDGCTLEGADRLALRLRRAGALRAAGHCEAAARAFLTVAEDLSGVERADARLDAIEQYLVGGCRDEGLGEARALLREVGLGIPDGPFGRVSSLRVERARLFFARLDVTAGRPATLTPAERVRMRACWRMATGPDVGDPRLAAVFSARHLRYALDARDPDALARGFALEASLRARTGDPEGARALLVRADTWVRQCNDSLTPAFVQLLAGLVLYRGGHWRDAARAFDGALAQVSATPRDASWASSTAQVYGAWARLYAGEWRELQRRAGQLRREALAGTHRALRHGYQVGIDVVTALLADRAEAAARSLAAAMEGGHGQAFQGEQVLALFMGAWVDLYVGTPGNTLGKVRAAWPDVQRSALLQFSDVRLQLHHARGFACVSVGGGVHADEALASAEVLEELSVRGASATAGILRAAVAFQRGDVADARARLEAALAAFNEAEMAAFAAATSWRLGQLAGRSGEGRCNQARGALAALGAVCPERMLEVLAPGFGAAGAAAGTRFTSSPVARRPTLTPPASMSPDDDLPYARIARLGRGAFGEVWEAEGPDGRRVAVKRLEVAPAHRARVAREIATLRQLRIPGVVPFVDARLDADHAWIAMELVRGRPFPGAFGPGDEGVPLLVAWDALFPRVEALLEVLARVHAAGFVHRDLKPDNILVDAEGRPTVLDFGLARASAQGHTLTRAGALLGTPRYMSPELCRGVRADARTDLYAVGILIVEALTGQVPHDGLDLHAFVGARARTPAPPLPVGCAPTHVVEAVASVLAVDPADRPRSAGALLRLLRGEGQRREPLPRLGGRGEIERLHAVLDAGVDATVGGLPGTGRDRCVEDAAAACAAAGATVVWLPPGARPLESLRSALGRGAGAADPAADLGDALSGQRDARAVLVTARLDALDRWSRRLLQRPGVVRPPLLSTCDGTGTVTLAPLALAEVRALFGAQRVYGGVADEAATLLMARTGGGAGRLEAEMRRWCTLGLARWEGPNLVVDAADYERLVTLPPPVVAAASADDSDRAAVLWALGTAGDLPRDTLAAIVGIEPWELGLRIEELHEDGVVAQGPSGWLARVATTLDSERLDALQRSLADAFPVGTPRRVRHLLAAGERVAAWGETARAAEALLAEGRAAAAVGLLEESFADDGGGGALDDPWGVARVLARAVWADGSAGVARRAVYLGNLCGLPGAALALLGHAPALAPSATLDEVRVVPPLDDVVLESLRRDLLVTASRRVGDAHVMEDAIAWSERSGDGPVIARARAWQARSAIEAGRLDAAASFADDASRQTDDPSLALDQLYLLAEATKLQGNFARAEALGDDLRRRAQHLRAPLQEARAEEVVRWVQMRRGDLVAPDPARVVAVRALGRPRLLALAALTEARLALVVGAHDLARDLARDAMDAGDAAGVPADVRLCAEAVFAAAGGRVDLPRLVRALASLSNAYTRDEAMGYLVRAGRTAPPVS